MNTLFCNYLIYDKNIYCILKLVCFTIIILINNNEFKILGKYLQFMKLIKKSKFSEASSLYIELLRSNICPT